jgi:uncharacterized protein YhfF
VSISAKYESFWASAVAANPRLDRSRLLEAFAFGNNEEMALELGKLVLEGTKRATASLVWAYEAEGSRQPEPGDISIVTTWGKEPICMIETVSVEIVPFEQVTEEFACAEGEDDKTLESWRRKHAEFFEQECKQIGRTPSPEMLICCERFEVVYRP